MSNATHTIGAGTRVEGNITGSGSLVVEGQVSGQIELTGSVTVSEGAAVSAGVSASDVIVYGTISGDIVC
ncbi:MAG: cytoskeletal protein CcmA (bactofilin family), partial [Bradymonadia bacterium]